jgi:hypothetical protein
VSARVVTGLLFQDKKGDIARRCAFSERWAGDKKNHREAAPLLRAAREESWKSELVAAPHTAIAMFVGLLVKVELATARCDGLADNASSRWQRWNNPPGLPPLPSEAYRHAAVIDHCSARTTVRR